MLQSIERMLAALEENEISYCHWKSNEHLAEALDGDTDLDMLFLPSQRSLLDEVLNKQGLKRFRAVPLMQYNAIEDYIGFDEQTAKIWHLHLHYRMTLGEKHLKGYTVTPWGSLILQNRVKDSSGIYVSAAEDELILLLIRIALKLRFRDTGKRLGADDKTELAWLYERIDDTRFAERATAFLEEPAASLVVSLAKARPQTKNQFKKLQKALRKQLAPFTGYSRAGSFITRSKRELYWGVGAIRRHAGLKTNTPCRRLSPAGGCVVAFLGCDGAGKSTTLAYVAKEFSKKIDVKKVYLGSGDGSSSLLRKPMKLIAGKVGGKGVGHAVEREYAAEKKHISLKARLYSIAKYFWAMTLASEKKKKLKEIAKARGNGMLVLTDRYPQTGTSGLSDGPLLTRYLAKGHGFLYRSAKKEWEIYRSAALNPPDLTVKLVVPTETAILRKPEMTAEEIERKKAAVMAMNLSEHTAVIDTSAEKTVSFAKVMKEIWNML